MSEFPWHKSYPDFVNKTTEINYNSIVEIYEQSISIHMEICLAIHWNPLLNLIGITYNPYGVR